MSRQDAAEEAWRDANLDRHGNKLLTRGPDPDRVARHLTTGLPSKPSPPCPVCGVLGYRKSRRMADQTVMWCRQGHPHYLPRARQNRAYNEAFHD